MERHRLKTIIIIILAILNAFLLWSVFSRQISRYNASHGAAEQLSRIFAADGISLDVGAIPLDPPPSLLPLRRDSALEDSFAAALLGEDASLSDVGGGIRTCENAAGSAFFRENGNFEFAGLLGGDDGVSTVRKVCRTFGAAVPDADELSTEDGEITTQFISGDVPVINCPVTFELQGGVLTRVYGTLPGISGSDAPSAELLNAVSALTAFHRRTLESGTVISEITDIRACYELQRTSYSPMTLVPCWRITADTADYYVNCLTGAVSSG